MNAKSQKRLLPCPFDYIAHIACFVYLNACLLGSLESNSVKPNYWPPQWPLLITVQCPKERDINSSEKTVPLASTSRPELVSLTTPLDEMDLIPEFGIIEFTTEKEKHNSTEILIQQPSTISTVSKTISITTIQNQDIETLLKKENILTSNTPMESPEVTPSSTVLETATDVIDFDKKFNDNSAPDPETTTQNQESKTLKTTENIVTTNTPVESPEVTPSSTELETSTDVIDFDKKYNDNSVPDLESTTQNQEIKTLPTIENIVTTNTPVETPEKTVPLASTLRPDLASLTTPFDEIDLIPEFGIIEFTTETETPNFTEILFQQSSTISTSPKTISITTTQNQEIETLQTTENIVTSNTLVETPELLLVTPSSTVLETSTDVIDFDKNFNDNLAPDPEAFTVFLDVLFDQFNESGSSSTPKFTDILFATLNETLEKVPKEEGEKFSSLLFANLPSKEV